MEGMLFPDTYEIDEDADERSFLRRLVTQLDDRLDGRSTWSQGRRASASRPYQMVIIASLVEEEARVPEDRAKIARVIYNRLEQGIPLGIDATSRYEAEIEGRSRDAVDFESDSPYNTRRVAGLPPTPIAAAGRASLEAALNPEPGRLDLLRPRRRRGQPHLRRDGRRVPDRQAGAASRSDLGCG